MASTIVDVEGRIVTVALFGKINREASVGASRRLLALISGLVSEMNPEVLEVCDSLVSELLLEYGA